jgi:hypothetical protein
MRMHGGDVCARAPSLSRGISADDEHARS